MKMYRDFNTGVIYSEKEIRKAYADSEWELVDEEGNKKYENFEECLDHFLDLGRQKISGYEEIEVNTGSSVSFEYDGIEFMFTVIENTCECYAKSQFQFAFELETGEIEADEEIIELLINNYENGNIDIDD